MLPQPAAGLGEVILDTETRGLRAPHSHCYEIRFWKGAWHLAGAQPRRSPGPPRPWSSASTSLGNQKHSWGQPVGQACGSRGQGWGLQKEEGTSLRSAPCRLLLAPYGPAEPSRCVPQMFPAKADSDPPRTLT